jgi:hypothetical protein
MEQESSQGYMGMKDYSGQNPEIFIGLLSSCSRLGDSVSSTRKISEHVFIPNSTNS